MTNDPLLLIGSSLAGLVMIGVMAFLLGRR